MWQFEANMMGGPHAFHQVPAAAREEALQAAYKVAAGPSGLTLDRTRCDFISLEKYKLCKHIYPDIQWPMHGGLMLAFIQWRKQKTASAKGGYSIAASIKSSFCKAARQLGMQHLVLLDAAVLYKTCRRGTAEGGSEGASSVSIRMVCYWEHTCDPCKHPAMLHAYKCMVLMCHLSLRSVEFKRSRLEEVVFKGKPIVSLLISLVKNGTTNMWAGMNPVGFLGPLHWYAKFLTHGKSFKFICHSMRWDGPLGDVSKASMVWGEITSDPHFDKMVHWCFLDAGVSEGDIKTFRFTPYSSRHLYACIAEICEWGEESQDGTGRWRDAFHAKARDALLRMAERYASDVQRDKQLRLRMCVILVVRQLVLQRFNFKDLDLMPDFDVLCESDLFSSSIFRGLYGGVVNIDEYV
jgi:hypothetical protein